ncbi:uncharacterized protein TNCV_1613541 [Trichonephila clavipes]|nr:uncharacterized protein TNCV_1613541 [Trichonephila clavipes]
MNIGHRQQNGATLCLLTNPTIACNITMARFELGDTMKIKMSEDLSKFKKKRTAVRSSLTKLINKIEGKINNENEPVDQFEAFIEQLNDKESNLSLLNTLIEDRLSVDTITEDMEASEEIKEKIIFWKTKLSSKIRRINSDSIQVDTVSRNIQVIDSNSFEYRFGNKNMLINAHLSNLLNLTPVKNPTDIVGLRNLYDRAETQIRSLASLGVKGLLKLINTHPVETNTLGTRFGIQSFSKGRRLSEFWKLENLGIEAEVSDEENIDNDIMSEFEAGISYQNKRYKVKFPWKPNMKTLLENNEEVARKRFLKLRSRFKNDSSLFEDYKLVVNNYLSEKIIERVSFEEENLKHNIFYLPHRAVIPTIKHHLKKYVDIFPDTFNHLNQSLYVDDFLCGNVSVQAALTTCIESKQILEDASMDLRKWRTNSSELNERLKNLNFEVDEHKGSLNTLMASRVLGVGWNEKSDTFYFDSSDLGTFLSKRINTKDICYKPQVDYLTQEVD